MNPELFALVLSGASFALSIISVVVSRRTWLSSNRPFIVLRLRSPKSGNLATIYSLRVKNIGNRTAVKVRFQELDNCIAKARNPKFAGEYSAITKLFDADRVLDCILPSELITGYFGCKSVDEKLSDWVPESEIGISVSYEDIDGRRFIGIFRFKIKPHMGLVDTAWGTDLEMEDAKDI